MLTRKEAEEPMKNIEGILEDLANAQRGNMGNPGDYIEMCSIAEATQAIKSLLREQLPKKMKVLPGSLLSPDSYTVGERDGFNSAIDEFNQMIDNL